MNLELIAGPDGGPGPAVSVILPTYNRAKFLPEALAAICGQTFTDWELIIVDDGSHDETAEVVLQHAAGWPQAVRYVRQANQGAYGARNTGLGLARGQYVAFYDSDDLWLPHHLADCAGVLAANAEVDWAFGACLVEEAGSGQVKVASTFHPDGQPRPFLRLPARAWGAARILDAESALNAVLTTGGIYAGLQNSVIRASAFGGRRFRTEDRDESEDVLTLIRFLAEGRKIAYFDNVHVRYRIHADNSTAPGGGAVDKSVRVYSGMLKGAEAFRAEGVLPPAVSRAYDRSLSKSYFWTYGYALLWQNGRRREALRAYRRAMALWPWDWRYWKTYLLAVLKVWFSKPGRAETTGGLA